MTSAIMVGTRYGKRIAKLMRRDKFMQNKATSSVNSAILEDTKNGNAEEGTAK